MVELMIETHIDPDNALSDAKQQLTHQNNGYWMRLFLEELIFPIRVSESSHSLREQIDEVDDGIIKLLGT